MRKQLAAALAIVALSGACREADRDTGAIDNDRSGTDTVVQSETVKDTTVITADTSIDVDTVEQTDNIDDKND
ncbi:MAG TPA: hypothetical protein VFR62_12740 [Gemmatimonadales bacterium]|jgi:hypothetical protein|nr:hypothetical protein [Gemmatimonadales bacterium]